MEQNRHLARRQAARQASRLWNLPWMRWKVEQNRHLARRQAARQASRQASRLWTLPWMRWKVEQNRHLARRQAARQASRLWKLQQRRDLARMRQASRQASRLWKLQQRRDVLGYKASLEAGLEAMESAIDAIESPNVLHSAALSSGSSMPHMHMPQAPKHAWRRHPTC